MKWNRRKSKKKIEVKNFWFKNRMEGELWKAEPNFIENDK